ncbi:MAG TPA: hypothetical protein VE129_14640 [Thermoanaerobaculia bacterium]|nr:hypothetical protein [Thermoanaerobaculia bacterium]
MSGEREGFVRSVRSIVDEYRDTCLWFLDRDYYPVTDDQIGRTLDRIERHGDRRAFQEAARLRTWLSRISKEASVV